MAVICSELASNLFSLFLVCDKPVIVPNLIQEIIEILYETANKLQRVIASYRRLDGSSIGIVTEKTWNFIMP